MSTQNPARSRPLSRNVVRLMKESRASPKNPKVIKAARRMGPKEIAYCEKQGEIFMTAVDMDVPISRFASLYMNSQVAGLLDVSFSQANGIDSDEISDLIQLPMLLESPELIVSLILWLNDVAAAMDENDSSSSALLKALSASSSTAAVPAFTTSMSVSQSSSPTGDPSIALVDAEQEKAVASIVKMYEYAYWLGYIYRYECLLHEEASRMVFSVLDEPLMRETYDQLDMRNINLADCAMEICQRLDMLILNHL